MKQKQQPEQYSPSGLVGAEKCIEIIFPDAQTRPCLRTFQKMQMARLIPSKRIGRLIFFDPSEVREAIDRQFSEKTADQISEDISELRDFISLIDHVLFFRKGENPPDEWQGTGEELRQRLCAIDSIMGEEGRRLLPSPVACGHFLGRLAREVPSRCTRRRTAAKAMWIIRSRNAANHRH